MTREGVVGSWTRTGEVMRGGATVRNTGPSNKVSSAMK